MRALASDYCRNKRLGQFVCEDFEQSNHAQGLSRDYRFRIANRDGMRIIF